MSKFKCPNTDQDNIKNHIKEGDIICSTDSKSKDGEFKYAKALFKADEINNYELQIECFKKIGDVYKARKDYIRATALYNMCITIIKEKLCNKENASQQIANLSEKIQEIKGEFLKNISIDKVIPLADNKKTLVFLRNNFRKELERIDKELNPYKDKTIEDYDPLETSNRNSEIKRANAINRLYNNITQNL